MKSTVKKYVVEIEASEATKWLHPEADLIKHMRGMISVIVTQHTTGPKPEVIVTKEEHWKRLP